MSTPRRTVLRVAGGSLLTVALAGCRHTAAASPSTSSSPPVATGTDPYPGDLALVAVAGAFDALLVQAYDLAADATAGPAPFAAYLTTARSHHAAHAAAWNRQLTAAGAPPSSADTLRAAAAMLGGILDAPDIEAAASRLLALERTAAATALAAVGGVSDAALVGLAASIAPVEAQHVGVLSLLLGDLVAPAAQLTTAGALGVGSLS